MKRLLASALLLAGCATTGSNTAVPEDPAYIVRATPESRVALRQAVERSLETPIVLDEEALTHDSILVVDRAERRDIGQSMMRGRDPREPGIPERFHLVRVLDHCVLVHDRTGRHFDLQGTICAPM